MNNIEKDEREQFIYDLKVNNDKMLVLFQQALYKKVITMSEYEIAHKLARYNFKYLQKIKEKEVK